MRYLVAGGLAVNVHGYLCFTKDADFVVHLVLDNIVRTFTALACIGYKLLVPADEPLRESWIRDKQMQVLQFWSDAYRETL